MIGEYYLELMLSLVESKIMEIEATALAAKASSPYLKSLQSLKGVLLNERDTTHGDPNIWLERIEAAINNK